MLQTVRAEKVEEKNGSIVPFQCFLPELWSLNCLKKCIFCNFVLTSGKNLSLLKQFTYMHWKMGLFVIMLRLTVLEILVFKVEEFC